MELKEGMYVRTKKGYIAKILGVDYLLDDNGCELNNIEAIYLDEMVDEIDKDIYAGCVSQIFKECRVSDDSIDLIKSGDVIETPKGIFQVGYIENDIIYTDDSKVIACLRKDEHLCFENTIIKSIVTKEQFESVKYEVK